MTGSLCLTQFVLITGLGAWLTLACFNNIIDKGTNKYLLADMLSMRLLKTDVNLGNGLKRRAINGEKWSGVILYCVIFTQLVVCIFFWVSSAIFIFSYFVNNYYSLALYTSGYALVGFMCLWFWFTCGGLWFGYWIKMSQVQSTHFLLLIISLLSTLVINMH